jgi:hypothetical protein
VYINRKGEKTMAGTAYHIPGTNDLNKTVCGRPIEVAGRPQVLLTTNAEKKKGTVCGRCKALKTGQARTEKIAAKHRKIREAGEKKADSQDLRVARKRLAKIDGAPKPGKRQPPLLALGERMPNELIVSFKGQDFTAAVLGDGRIHLNNLGETFNSPSRAGKAITGREIDGWTFWSYLKADGTREKLDALRKAVA